jgi:hypothetical protein
MKVTKNKKTDRPQKRQVRFHGITADAKALGYSRPYLWMVLTGAKISRRAAERYAALKASQNGGEA